MFMKCLVGTCIVISDVMSSSGFSVLVSTLAYNYEYISLKTLKPVALGLLTVQPESKT